ncbi:MAG: glycosyl hydrolase [Verrucomicrobia bacterium]|nr:glycosyl hydrolase [Verrucomicrobiota bacterium]
MKYGPRMLLVLIQAVVTGTLLAVSHADELAARFRSAPDENKPWCYWYWLNGDITADGITKDLETMAKVGIRRAMIGNIEGGGPVKMMSPEWMVLTRHALKEAARVGVEIMMFNAPGWSQSGGPWIKPEQSMRRVTWAEFSANGGPFSQVVRSGGNPVVQDIAVLAVPKKEAVTLASSPRPGNDAAPSLAQSSWIWHPAEDGTKSAPAATRYFRRGIQVDPAKLKAAAAMVAADNAYILWINDHEVKRGANWQVQEIVSIKEYLRPGPNVIAIAVTNTEVGPAGLIANIVLQDQGGKTASVVTDASWQAAMSETKDWRSDVKNPEGWQAARVLGPASVGPWGLSGQRPGVNAMYFRHTAPFKARALVVKGSLGAKLFALRDGKRELVADIQTGGRNPTTDFLPDGIETFSFKEVSAQEFELEPCGLPDGAVELTSEPKVAQVIEKQMGRMHPDPSPTWQSYIFPDTVEPDDASTVIGKADIINLTDNLDASGKLSCQLPAGNWTVIYFGMITTGKMNAPAPPEATGLEVDKMSKPLIEYHFNSMFGELLKQLTPQERSAFKGITADSYEMGSQNWTDGFAVEFKKRNGYDPIVLLPVMTGRVVDNAKTSDQFLWDLRRTVADMIAEYYVGGLRDVAHKHDMTMWCENYGHWGFPGEFLVYGSYSDEIGGEFWTNNPALGTIECRAASSCAHIYGKRKVYAESFTSGLDLGHHPYNIKARGEELFCEGINQTLLHVYAHQPKDGVPGKNPGFGTAFHRNTPWFVQSRDWVKYLQRVNYMLQQGEPVADAAIYIGDFAPQMTGPANPVPTGYDYDYMNSDALLRTVHVVNGEWVVYDENDPQQVLARYKLLAMPKLDYIRPHVRKRIDELQKAGGRIVDGVPVSVATLQAADIAPIVADTTCNIRWKARRLDDGMIFFLSNFEKVGQFEATLRVTGKVPELFNPVTGEVRTMARYQAEGNGTRICLNVNDRADSFFVVFREKPSQPSVLTVRCAGQDVAPAELGLFYDNKGTLTAESAAPGVYQIIMSDATEKSVRIDQAAQASAIAGPWQDIRTEAGGFTIAQETSFTPPAGVGKNQRVILDLGQVQVMARVTLNGRTYDTLWMPPFELDVSDNLKPGINRLEVLVTSTTQGKPTLGKVQLKTVSRSAVK